MSATACRQCRRIKFNLPLNVRTPSYAKVASGQYRPQLLARTRRTDWMRILEDIKKDIDIAQTAAAE